MSLIWASFSPSQSRWLLPFSSRRMDSVTHLCELANPCIHGGLISGPGSLGHRSCVVFAVSLSHVAGCLQDDAPVRRASRPRTTSSGAHCALFDTALTDRDRSRQNFSSALRAPLTLRLSPEPLLSNTNPQERKQK